MLAKGVTVGQAGVISVVDFRPFLDNSAKQQVADAIVQSFKDTGFVYLINHGLPQEKVDEMFGWVSDCSPPVCAVLTLEYCSRSDSSSNPPM